MKKKIIALSVISIENLKTLKYHIFFINPQFFLLLLVSVAVNDEIMFKAEELIEILKILDLIYNMEKHQAHVYHFKEKKWKKYSDRKNQMKQVIA